MKTLKITYSDGSTATTETNKAPEVLFQELFSHLDEKTQKKCKVEEVKKK